MSTENELREFLKKMDWEGGVEGMLFYGGADAFPEEVRELARNAQAALSALESAIETIADSVEDS